MIHSGVYCTNTHRKTMVHECQRNLKTGALIKPNRSQGDLVIDSRLKTALDYSAAEFVDLIMLCIDMAQL